MPDQNIFPLIIGFVVFVLIIKMLTEAINTLSRPSKNTKEETEEYSYEKKKFFMSALEHDLFDILHKALSNKYHIFPQVHLSSIIDHKIVGQNWNAAFRHINGKSVDYVICDKAYIAPLLAIELDDSSHDREDRMERDEIVERIISEAGLPMLRITKGHNGFEVEKILKDIEEMIRTN